MDSSKVLSTLAGSQVPEITTLTAVADSNKSLAGKSITTTNHAAKSIVYWYEVDGVSNTTNSNWSPVLGTGEVSTITAVADTAGSLASKYFTIAHGPSTNNQNVYVYYEVVDYLGGPGSNVSWWKNCDPQQGVKEVTTVVLPAEAASNQAGKYWNIYDGANNRFYVWYSTGASTDPAPGGTGIKVLIGTDESADSVALKTMSVMNSLGKWWVEKTATTGQLRIVNLTASAAPTDSTNGTMTAFTPVVVQSGVAAVALSNYGRIKVKIVAGETAINVATKTRAEIARYVCPTFGKLAYVTSGSTTAIIVTNNIPGNCTNVAAGTSGMGVATTTAGTDPLASTTLTIKIPIITNETALNVALKTRTAINNNKMLTSQWASGSTTSIVINNRIGLVAGTATTTTTGFTLARTQTGTTTTVQNAAAAAARYWVIPAGSERFYVNAIGIQIGALTAAPTDQTKLASATALATGIRVAVLNADATVKKQLALIKNNADLINYCHEIDRVTDAANGSIFGQIDAKELFGEEIEIDGGSGEYLEFYVQDTMVTVFGPTYFSVMGKVRSTTSSGAVIA